ncbi:MULTISPECIES: hypothetical protein [Hymenobacter]|uniref:Outer membrane protein beta-barrel domain-containing protein n=1 Tax=Hymenobacter profundi TaxID=1982110 RepID=A0ABS6X0S6_9BACT|nr:MULTISPECIES: hypothetical protein [Hymenobacter]MBW3129092.1 hypothetical protein [Hymenobacter profundi]QNE40269.1 hypothetical protein F1C16_12210 [Hymenobacter sp. NBH84]
MKLVTIAAIGGLVSLCSVASYGQTQQLPIAPEAQLPAKPQEYALESTYRTSSLSVVLGWGTPYGWGLEYSHLLQPNWDVNVGLGVGISGGKIGVGTRYYLSPERKFSPFFGANLVRSGRIDNIELDVNGEHTEYSIRPNALLHLRSGLRWQPGHVGLMGTLGYGARLSNDPIVYSTSYPTPSPMLRNWANSFGPGGIEISLALVIGLGR